MRWGWTTRLVGGGTLLLFAACGCTRSDPALVDPCALHDEYTDDESALIQRFSSLRLVCTGGEACAARKRAVARILRRDVDERRRLARAAARLCGRFRIDGSGTYDPP